MYNNMVKKQKEKTKQQKGIEVKDNVLSMIMMMINALYIYDI